MPGVKLPFRVRKSFEDTKSQLASYSILYNAIQTCKNNPGYKVYDVRTGEVVYDPQSESVEACDDIESSTTSYVYEDCNKVKCEEKIKKSNKFLEFIRKIFSKK